MSSGSSDSSSLTPPPGRDHPPQVDVERLVGLFFAHAAAGQMPAESLGEQKGGESKLFGTRSPRPVSMGQRHLGSAHRIEEHPGLATATGSDIRVSGVEMPAAADHLVIVALLAGLPCRERQGDGVVRTDQRARLVAQVEDMNVIGAAAVGEACSAGASSAGAFSAGCAPSCATAVSGCASCASCSSRAAAAPAAPAAAASTTSRVTPSATPGDTRKRRRVPGEDEKAGMYFRRRFKF